MNRQFLNGTIFSTTSCPKSSCCTLAICPWSYAYIQHIPNLGGTSFYLSLFSLLLLTHLLLGLKYKTQYFSIAMICGLILEVLGYIGRLMQRHNPFSFTAFLLSLICLTIAPAFMCAGIYVCLGRIVVVYGEHISRLRPSTYTFIFVSSDLLSLVLQAAGGAVTSIAPDGNQSLRQTGINIMLAGLSLQVASLVVFIALCADFAIRVTKAGGQGNNSHRDIWTSRRWIGFLIALFIATLTILVRSAFRVAELSAGFKSSLANNEVTFMILEGAMVSIACIVLTIWHPGYAFHRQWREAAFGWKKNGRAGSKGSESSEAELTDMK